MPSGVENEWIKDDPFTDFAHKTNTELKEKPDIPKLKFKF